MRPDRMKCGFYNYVADVSTMYGLEGVTFEKTEVLFCGTVSFVSHLWEVRYTFLVFSI